MVRLYTSRENLRMWRKLNRLQDKTILKELTKFVTYEGNTREAMLINILKKRLGYKFNFVNQSTMFQLIQDGYPRIVLVKVPKKL